MSITNNIKKWVDFHSHRLNYWAPLFMVLFAVAFVLSDWTYAGLTFADYILIALFAIMFLIGQIRIGKKQFILISIFVLLLMGSNIANYFWNDYYVSLPLQAVSTIRITFYIVIMLSFFNFIRNNKLEKRFLNINNIFAIVAIVIGVYISIAIISGELPYEKLWTFTRQDQLSYYFYGDSMIVRTRSLFSEPAHFGFYLNTILAANLFNKRNININYFMVIPISLGIILTFSYSMIFISGIFWLLHIVQQFIRGNLQWNNWYLLTVIVFLVFIYLFWDLIDTAIVERTRSILSGEDNSAFNRLVESWNYVNPNRWWFGNGLGHSPPITNIYSYFLTDLGLFGFVPIVVFTIWLFTKNYSFGILFILLNFSRGGYLAPHFWIMLSFILIYSLNDQYKNNYEKRYYK